MPRQSSRTFGQAGAVMGGCQAVEGASAARGGGRLYKTSAGRKERRRPYLEKEISEERFETLGFTSLYKFLLPPALSYLLLFLPPFFSSLISRILLAYPADFKGYEERIGESILAYYVAHGIDCM